ncbi:T9SS type A sorting domain-containing protein [Pseudopedobacter beijingensis]|uniref:T9SS type A sorting domain-containing protein n=1 Tax=Pseudopedobacter beijingensis TaxID=1207056 RepID=A0ABW4IIS8_9SPHI
MLTISSASAQVLFTETNYPTNGFSCYIVSNDFNGDGHADLAVGNQDWSETPNNGILILLNNGDGTYGAPTLYLSGNSIDDIHSGDLNGDGHPDMVGVDRLNNKLLILLNDGSGAFTPSTSYSVSGTLIGVRISDINNDGNGDVIIADNGNSQISVLLNKGNGDLLPPANYPVNGGRQLAVGDLNNDGYTDIIATNGHFNNISVLLNNGNGTFAPQTTYPTGDYAHYVTVGDLNSDGLNDVVVSNRNDKTISIFLNNGGGTFAPQLVYNVGSYPTTPAIGDLNGDGKADIVVSNVEDDKISVLLNDGNGNFTTQPSVTPNGQPYSIIIADFNGDGKNDMATANYQNENVSVLLNTGTMPISLTDFTATAQGNRTKLIWQTASESNNKEFIVYRSNDGQHFTEITRIAGAGNSSAVKNYYYDDENPLNGNNYYKLVQIDLDNKETELDIRIVSFELTALSLQLYPNPTDDVVNISFSNSKYNLLTVTDLSGKVLQQVQIKPDESSMKVSLGNYPAGIYLLHFSGNEGSVIKKVIRK